MVSHYFTDLQVAVMHQEMQQQTINGREEENSSQVHMDVNKTGFKFLRKAMQMFYEERNALNAFVRPLGYTYFGEFSLPFLEFLKSFFGKRRSLLHTCATKGVIRAPNLAIALEVPIAKALFSVGNT